MTKSSVFIILLLKLYDYFKSSRLAYILGKIQEAVACAFRGCLLGKIFAQKNADDFSAGSGFYSILDSIWKWIYGILKAVYHVIRGSVLFRCVRFLFSGSQIFKTENLLTAGIFVMFVCPHEMWNNAYGLIFAVGIAMLYIIALLRKRDFRSNIRGIWLPFLLFIAATLLALVTSAYIKDSIRVFMFFITAFILCIATYGILTDSKRFSTVSFGIFAAVVVTGVVAIIQKKMGIAVDPSLTDVALNQNMPGRAFSTLANPNNFAEFLVILLPFCFAFAATRQKQSQKIVLLMMLVIPFLALLFTYSRSGWLGFAITILVFVVLYNKKLLPVIIILGIVAIPFLPHSILARIMTIGNMKDTSSAYRIDIWTGAFHMLKYFWYRGTGLGPVAFKEVYPLYAHITAIQAPHTHMLFLEVFAEMGIVGLLFFTYLIVALVVRSCKVAAKTASREMKLYSIAAASSMAGILTIGFAEYVWFYPRVMFAFFIAIGIAMAAVRKRKDEQ